MHKRRLKKFFFCAGLLLTAMVPSLCPGSSLVIVDKEFYWFSPSLEDGRSLSPKNTPGLPSGHLGRLSYRDYFDAHGGQPAYEFLAPLVKAEPQQAKLQGDRIIFPSKTLLLRTPAFPQHASPAEPYLLATPAGDYIVAVQPCFTFMNKEALNYAAIYSRAGDPLMETDSLPTHVCRDAPHLLVSAERSGCCESLKWTVRFHDLQSKTHLMLGCPEGHCGNFLFLRLGASGPFLVAYETLAMLPGAGYAVQTDIHLVSDDLNRVGSGRILYAVRKAEFPTTLPGREFLYSVSNLAAVTPQPAGNEWMLAFKNQLQHKVFRLTSEDTPAPIPLFLTSRNARLGRTSETVSHHGTDLGELPLLLIAQPGEYSFTVGAKEGPARNFRFTAAAGGASIITFE